MLKVTLQYQDSYGAGDGKKVFMILTRNKIPIMKTKDFISKVRLTALFKDYDEVQTVLYQLNSNCSYEVRLVNYKKIKDKKVKVKKTKEEPKL
jgi:hypothetical protein